MKNYFTHFITVLMLLTSPLWIFAEGQQEADKQNNTADQFAFKPYGGADGLSGRNIMEKANSTLIAKDIIAEITMTLINKNGVKRVREISIKSKEVDNLNKSVMHFKSPADVQGTGFLMIESVSGDTDMWLYLPELKKVRRIASNGKNDSFMGSDIAYSDMEDKPLDDYTYNRFEDMTVDSQDCYMVESVPANDAVKEDTGYSKIIYWISKEKMIPLRAVFFDVKGNFIKNMQIKDIRKFNDTWIPTFIEVEDVKKNHKTVMELKNIELDTNPDDSFFTQQYLKRGN
ncbi:MAG: outer membrane lipoprotein-sorting protein [Spirochaetales bacterium]|nr:outer membrane lipoprotein-sorting protein [Spirochaetales bacterium]